ncbi:NADH dehydrogenase [Undibacterium terreum]|uniref:NADH:ubiquinone reductase (non-electrogenic) n=2 Tax=Undibacterium terreum TaxID=1224302 RepID=A0A916USA1_9BURK|nr:NADH dehydrogenase [Undibacterium terreum]
MHDELDEALRLPERAVKEILPRVVIVGGGIGGTAAARALKKTPVEVLLIDRRNHYVFQPLLYQVATSVLSESEIASPIRQLSDSQENLSVIMGEVVGVDTAGREVVVDCENQSARRVPYDFLILATGTHPTYFGNDRFSEFAPGLKTLTDARRIRDRILGAFERAELEDDLNEQKRHMTFVLVGGGPAGVELAASLAQMTATTLRSNFRRIDPSSASIILLEGGKSILPAYGDELSEKATAQLKKIGVEIRTGVMVENIDADGVVAAGVRIPSSTVIWTAGVKPFPLGDWLGAKTDRAGRVLVGPYLEVPGHMEVFAIGDTAGVLQDNKPLPGVAQVALQQGKYVGNVIADRVRGRVGAQPFRYNDKGNMAVVGKNFALLQTEKMHTSGFVTWLIWAFIHIMSLPHAQNRIRVYTQWFWWYFTGQRSSRIIAEPEAVLSKGQKPLPFEPH